MLHDLPRMRICTSRSVVPFEKLLAKDSSEARLTYVLAATHTPHTHMRRKNLSWWLGFSLMRGFGSSKVYVPLACFSWGNMCVGVCPVSGCHSGTKQHVQAWNSQTLALRETRRAGTTGQGRAMTARRSTTTTMLMLIIDAFYVW